VSVPEGSCGLVSESVNAKPAATLAGAPRVAVGATLSMVTLVASVALRPPVSVTRTAMFCTALPSSAENETV
jgi:hypothetical protein